MDQFERGSLRGPASPWSSGLGWRFLEMKRLRLVSLVVVAGFLFALAAVLATAPAKRVGPRFRSGVPADLEHAIWIDGHGREPVLLVVADPDCSHCESFIDVTVKQWRSNPPNVGRLVVVFSKKFSSGSITLPDSVPAGSVWLVDSLGAYLRGIQTRGFPALFALNKDGLTVASYEGAQPADTIRAILGRLPF